jgi:hypothetical protein
MFLSMLVSPWTDHDVGASSKLAPSLLIAGNFLPFRLKISPNNVILSSYFVDSSRLSLIFGNPLLAHPLLSLQSGLTANRESFVAP